MNVNWNIRRDLIVSVEVSGDKHYDLVVIGGGSGGLACSKEGNAFYLLHM